VSVRPPRRLGVGIGDLWCSLECTPACQAGGRGFKSRQVRGRIAQSVERAPEKREVVGSTPTPTTGKALVTGPFFAPEDPSRAGLPGSSCPNDCDQPPMDIRRLSTSASICSWPPQRVLTTPLARPSTLPSSIDMAHPGSPGGLPQPVCRSPPTSCTALLGLVDVLSENVLIPAVKVQPSYAYRAAGDTDHRKRSQPGHDVMQRRKILPSGPPEFEIGRAGPMVDYLHRATWRHRDVVSIRLIPRTGFGYVLVVEGRSRHQDTWSLSRSKVRQLHLKELETQPGSPADGRLSVVFQGRYLCVELRYAQFLPARDDRIGQTFPGHQRRHAFDALRCCRDVNTADVVSAPSQPTDVFQIRRSQYEPGNPNQFKRRRHDLSQSSSVRFDGDPQRCLLFRS
jgi:hypothetical protein